ncbi:DUF4122 family protein [uncultured Alistipes sp.]|uniref:DUF4122 family protein n=1 Tax=uncultured Alistipes sp. TaxID=538949 RepID=UPI00272D4060|nr:DUF4122 family protein [uncultured Alistipes sp.]
MEWLYFTVKVGCTLYLLYRLWETLFRHRLFGIWERLFKATPPTDRKAEHPKDSEVPDDEVLGKTHVVYLEDPVIAATIPVRSEDLPPSDFIGEEEEISADAVEHTLSEASSTALPGEEELYEDAEPAPPDEEFSRGLTYDEISNAVGVLTTAAPDVDNALAAARTIFDLKNTDLFEFFTTQVSNAETIEKLFETCLDEKDQPQRHNTQKADVSDFQWERYV